MQHLSGEQTLTAVDLLIIFKLIDPEARLEPIHWKIAKSWKYWRGHFKILR